VIDSVGHRLSRAPSLQPRLPTLKTKSLVRNVREQMTICAHPAFG
jgi:hypothetical protein